MVRTSYFKRKKTVSAINSEDKYLKFPNLNSTTFNYKTKIRTHPC